MEPTAVNSNGTRYTTSDHLGSPRVVTNSSASVISRHDYKPFGEEIGLVGGRTTGIGYAVIDGLRSQFTAKERDVETGLDFFKARYYSSTQGRFTSWDSFGGSTINPQTLNRYAYVLGNPLRYRDPSGRLPMVGASGDLNDWWKWSKRMAGDHSGMKPSMPRGLCGSGCGGQDPNKPSVPPAIAPAGVPDTPEGTVGTPTVTEWHPIPPHRSFWQKIKDFFGFGSPVAASTGVSMWGRPETLQEHFQKHGADFGSRTPEEYAQEAQDFLLRSQAEGFPTKIGPDGVIRVYDPETNTFAAYNMDGSRTIFKPFWTRFSRGFYWEGQPGRAPWTPQGEPEVEPEIEPEIDLPIEPIP